MSFSKIEIKGDIVALSGLHIGTSAAFSPIGAIDNPVIKDPLTNLPRGNVLRYHIDINGVEVYADVLFRSMSMFNVGEKINVGVADHNCVRL